MDDLATAFAVLVADPPVPPEPITEVAGRASRVRRRRTRRRVVTGTAALVVALVLGSSLLVDRSGDIGLSTDGTPTVAPADADADRASTTADPVAPDGGSTSAPAAVVPTERFPFTAPSGFRIDPEPSRGEALEGVSFASFHAARPLPVSGASSTISVTVLRGPSIRTAVFLAVDPVDLAVRFTNDTTFRPATIGGREVALRESPPVSGAPWGVPDKTGTFVVFAIGGGHMVQISATSVEPPELEAVIGSLDDALLLALSEDP